MPVPIEAYIDEGVMVGVLAGAGPIRQRLEAEPELDVAQLRAQALDGRRAEAGSQRIPVDLLLLVVPDEAEVAVHAVWHELHLAIGPYVVDGRLPTQPGFDPGRALARPGGTFVLLGDVTIRDGSDPERVLAAYPRILVNRYEVELVRSALMLAYHFPGAVLEPLEPRSSPAGPAASQVRGMRPADA
jgi:hypothetical protein